MMKEPPWETLSADVPSKLSNVVRRCLEKDPRQRMRDVGDVRLAMEGVFETTVAVPSEDLALCTPQGLRQALPWGAGLVVAVIVGLTVWGVMRQADGPSGVVRVGLAGTGMVESDGIAISPDGTHIVYASLQADGDGTQLYLRRLDELTETPLRGTEGGFHPLFSPDGAWVAYKNHPSNLQKVSIFGGAPETVVELTISIAGTSWGDDDQVILGRTSGGLVRVPASGGEPQELTALDAGRGEVAHRWPSIIPNHQAVLYVALTPDDPAIGELAVLALDSREVTRLGLAGTYPRYVETGHLVYVADDSSLRAVSFDADRLSIAGDPVTLIEGIMLNRAGWAGFSISDTGRLIHMTGSGGGATYSLAWVNREGTVTTSLLEDEDGIAYPRLSPGGDRVGLQRVTSDTYGVGTQDIWVLDVERGLDTKLTDGGTNLFPTWTADGSRVTFNSARSGTTTDVYTRPADASRPAELLIEASEALVPGEWSPDGQTFVYYEINRDTERDLWVLPVDGTPSPFLVTEFNERCFRHQLLAKRA